MIDMVQVGRTIFQQRKKLGWTQAELGERVHVSHQAVSKWERGEGMPDLESLAQLAEVFQVKIDDLLHGAPIDTVMVSPSPTWDSANLWEEIKQIIHNNLSKDSYITWFKYTKGKLDGKTLIVESPNSFAKDWLETRYQTLITKTLLQVTGGESLDIRFDCTKESSHRWKAT